MFQGVILHLDTNKFLPAGVQTAIPFPLPVRDTMAFWNAATPEKIIIPAGVEVVRLNAGWFATGTVVDIITVTLIELNGVLIVAETSRGNEQPGCAITTGARVVSEGDEFVFYVFTQRNVTATGAPRTFFSLEALQVVL